MSLISFRVPKELKRRMEELKHINWSEILRRAIKETLEREKSRSLAKAVLINERIRKKAPKGWDSTKAIRSGGNIVMARPVVVDASVVAKWYLEEEYTEKALKLRDMHVNGEIELTAPELLLFEVLNAIRYSRFFP